MKKYISILLITVLLLAGTQSFAEGKTSISFDSAKETLLNNSLELKRLDNSLKDTKTQYEKAVERASGINPEGDTIETTTKDGWSTRYIHYNDITKVQLTLQRDVVPDQQRLALDTAKYNRQVTENSLVTSLRSVYLSIFSADNALKLQKDSYEYAKSVYEQNKRKYEQGMITVLDFEEAEYNLLKAEKDLKAAERQKEAASMSLNNFIGSEFGTVYDEVIFSESYEASTLKAADYYIQQALTKRLELISLQREIPLLEREKGIREMNTVNERYPDARQPYEDLLNELDSKKLQLETSKLSIEDEIKEVYVDVVTSGKSVENLQKTLKLQESNLESTKKRYELGLISLNTYKQAQLSLTGAENSYKAAVYDYNTKVMRLENASGLGPAY